MTNGHGGARPGAGRPKGATSKVTQDVRELALIYGPAAMQELARLSLEAVSEATRVAAAKEVLDRAYGRAPQPAQGGDDEHDDPRTESTWIDRAKALALFLARIEQERAIEQEKGTINLVPTEPRHD